VGLGAAALSAAILTCVKLFVYEPTVTGVPLSYLDHGFDESEAECTVVTFDGGRRYAVGVWAEAFDTEVINALLAQRPVTFVVSRITCEGVPLVWSEP
jgi:hypothetical protein